MSLSAIQAVEVLRAAGEPSRLRILALLSHEELAVLELCKVLDQSQPRVSRHLKLLAEAGLVERFPDGAWVFYRLVAGGLARRLADETLAAVDPADPILIRDAERLQQVRAERSTEAGEYFARNAARWDEIRSLYVSETAVEAAVLKAAGPGPFKRLVDLGSGTGRMLTLLGPHAQAAVGLDLSQQMLNIARRHVADAGLERCELRHGDIFGTRLPGQSADLVVVHQVLHYLGDPAAAVREAARLVAEDGRLIIVDFAPHSLEFLREQHQHRRLGFAESEMERWLNEAGLTKVRAAALPPARGEGLTVKIWTAERVRQAERTAA
ncbi:MAG: metalloregulator ArsR/SmtB family transcription factor [Phenylobacterium sp.]|jgi:ubiquinone/menaquinone biosynthesis C-methylase UbiE/DNA-binding transcriptional ArsR family regulator|uniref:ArsR/SmtB family transcription factor n=1 Tax=Phenylobacterium sp. TaxID=1871053 RepID=UPI001B7A259B|nr:metalloregulator ArsR/SmtB family transcription factor [Phenylobacterium sp.]MBP7649969.1 metalloregulator ArsR/SmtB family transcription factor [Phenylobacterium sp.]MBP7816072.1 metalloregulator ArsR/SmtB family transcription factor [Phenylobacterium sp.]MBP9230886.1 metalloregulator ArsR/SmtB family transcription factor [Phenylobacterium sp.]MBP9755411.1 metalloregulator ArsR/SmtB family transcription factor [Phenylobacterium sp.]